MKKAKRLLCLSLAIATAFTATLSSTASAASIGNQLIDDNYSFSCAILDELFEKSEEDSYTENPNNGISLLWLEAGHNATINYDAANLSASQKQIIKNCSKWADKYFKASGGSVATVPALHGGGNYVVNLEFLWYFSIFLGRQNNPSTSTEMNTAIKSARTSAINKIKNTTAYSNRSTNCLQSLIDNSGTLVKYNGSTQKNDTVLTASVMKTRILGYAAHLVGDVYSHRTIIPSISGFDLNYFKSSFKTDVSKGIVEFRDLKYYLKNSNKLSEVNVKYTDCTTFYPNRFKDAKDNVSNLLTHNNASFDEFAFLCPNRANVKLESFKKFINQCGISTSYLPNSEWKKYST